MARVFGIGAGLVTLCGDMFKCALALVFGKLLYGDIGMALGGGLCLFGHCYPVFHDFRGGKGVSAGGIIGLFIDWRVGLAVIGVFLIVAVATKKVSLGSICGALTITAASLICSVSLPRLLLAIFSMTIVILRHSENIRRLFKGTEPDFRAAKT